MSLSIPIQSAMLQCGNDCPALQWTTCCAPMLAYRLRGAPSRRPATTQTPTCSSTSRIFLPTQPVSRLHMHPRALFRTTATLALPWPSGECCFHLLMLDSMGTSGGLPICIVHAAYKGSFPLAYAPPGAVWDYSNAGLAMAAPVIGSLPAQLTTLCLVAYLLQCDDHAAWACRTCSCTSRDLM